MLTARSILLTAAGLFGSYAASAQPSASTPDGPDFLFGLIIALLGLVAGAVVLTALLIATQLKHRRLMDSSAPASAPETNVRSW